MFPRWNVSARFGDEDTFALAAGVWFTDIRLVFFDPSISLEITVTAKSHRYYWSILHYTEKNKVE